MQVDATTLIAAMGIPSVVTGLCFWGIQKNITKRDKLDKAREKNEILLIQSVGATIALGEATAHSIRDGKCNGEMSAALA